MSTDYYTVSNIIPDHIMSLVKTGEECNFLRRLLKRETLSECFQTMTGFVGSKMGQDIREKIAFGAGLAGDAFEKSTKSSPMMFRFLKDNRKLFEDDVSSLLEVCDDHNLQNVKKWLLVYINVLEFKGFIGSSSSRGKGKNYFFFLI